MGTAIVTGASAGIGAEFARRLAALGHHVVLVARRRERIDALAAELGGEALAADLAQPADVERVAARACADDVTLLVNNAGINGYGPAEQVDPAVMAHVIAVNVTAPALLTRAALPGMLARGEGTIINVASMLAFASALPPDPMPHRATYAATKGFIATFTRTLAAELDGRPVRLQLLCPGYTKTEFHMTHGTAPVQGEAPTDEPFGMSPADVVQASLVALETGELVVVPGLEDPAAIERLIDAELGVRASDRGGALASRYSG